MQKKKKEKSENLNFRKNAYSWSVYSSQGAPHKTDAGLKEMLL